MTPVPPRVWLAFEAERADPILLALVGLPEPDMLLVMHPSHALVVDVLRAVEYPHPARIFELDAAPVLAHRYPPRWRRVWVDALDTRAVPLFREVLQHEGAWVIGAPLTTEGD